MSFQALVSLHSFRFSLPRVSNQPAISHPEPQFRNSEPASPFGELGGTARDSTAAPRGLAVEPHPHHYAAEEVPQKAQAPFRTPPFAYAERPSPLSLGNVSSDRRTTLAERRHQVPPHSLGTGGERSLGAHTRYNDVDESLAEGTRALRPGPERTDYV